MTEFVTDILPQTISRLSPLAYVLVFAGGVLTSIGPCNLSMVPVIIAYVAGQQELTRAKGFWLATFFTLGSSATFVLLGVVAASVGLLLGTWSTILHWIVALLCLAVGLNLLGALRLNLDLLARLRPRRMAVTGLLGALVLGLVVGLVGSQCGTPVLVAIVGLAMLKGKPAYGASLLFAYGLGRGVPIILCGTFTGVVKALPAMERWSRWMARSAGLLLIAVGLYFVWLA